MIDKDRIIKELFLIAIGSLIYAISMLTIDPVDLVPGSFLGVASVLHKLIGTPIGMVNLICNIPVLVLCLKFFGQKMLYYTIIIMAGTSGLIDLLSVWAPHTVYMPVWLIAAAGGTVMGIGAGILLVAGGTMAGTTALARLIQKKYTSWSVGNLLIIMDSAIILLGALLLRNPLSLVYSIIYTLFCSKTIDLVYRIQKKVSEREAK